MGLRVGPSAGGFVRAAFARNRLTHFCPPLGSDHPNHFCIPFPTADTPKKIPTLVRLKSARRSQTCISVHGTLHRGENQNQGRGCVPHINAERTPADTMNFARGWLSRLVAAKRQNGKKPGSLAPPISKRRTANQTDARRAVYLNACGRVQIRLARV